jgi:Double zinc ribbon
MLTCSSCGNAEPPGSRFCGSCGASFAPPAAALTCSSCGNEEPEGSAFCGSCGAAFAPVAEQPEQPVVTELPPEPEPLPAPTPRGKSRRRWVAAGAAVVVLMAAGAGAAVLTLGGGNGDATEAVSTDEPLLAETTEPEAPAATSSLAAGVAPSLAALGTHQGALNARVRALDGSTESLDGLRDAAEALAVGVMSTQASLDQLVSNGTDEVTTLALIRSALAAHLAYAETIAGFPAQPDAFTNAHAEAAIAGAEQVQDAYGRLWVTEPSLLGTTVNTVDHALLREVVPAPKPTPAPATDRVIELAALLVGIRPDDPPSEGRCFGAYTSRATLSVSGVVHRSGFVQCGDDANGDPSRASGVYQFANQAFPAGSRPVRLTAQAAIDESSSSSQRGTSVSWTVFYDGGVLCSRTVTWSGSRPSPRKLDCRFPRAYADLDLRRLRIQQVAFPASSGALWAGLLDPTLVVEPG